MQPIQLEKTTTERLIWKENMADNCKTNIGRSPLCLCIIKGYRKNWGKKEKGRRNNTNVEITIALSAMTLGRTSA